jgi:hypothetical protein
MPHQYGAGCARVYPYPAKLPAIEVSCGSHQILCQRADRAIFHLKKLAPVANKAAEAYYAGGDSRRNGRTMGSLSSKCGNIDSDRSISSPAAVETPAVDTQNDFGSAGFTALRSSRGSGGSGTNTTPLGILEFPTSSCTKLTATICACAVSSVVTRNRNMPRTAIPVRRIVPVIFTQHVLHALFPLARGTDISSAKRFRRRS